MEIADSAGSRAMVGTGGIMRDAFSTTTQAAAALAASVDSAGRTLIMSEADLRAYRELAREFEKTLRPVNIVERQMVQMMAQLAWHMNQLNALALSAAALEQERPVPAGAPERDRAAARTVAGAKSFDVYVARLGATIRVEQKIQTSFRQLYTQFCRMRADRGDAVRTAGEGSS